MINSTLSLFQLCDSNFPTGGFSHSFGLETYIQNDVVHDPDSFAEWLHVYLKEQLMYADGLGARLAYEALDDGDLEKVWHLDRVLTLQNMAEETRSGTQQMGRHMIKMAAELYAAETLQTYKHRIKQKASFGHPVLVFTMAAHYLAVPKQETLIYYLYSTVVSLVQNAVRAIPIGQTAGQKIIQKTHPVLYEIAEEIRRLDEEELGAISPGIELSQMQHERVNVRIFMS